MSVVVPSHGSARTVGPLLRSLRAQTLSPDRYEVVVVDTGADGTWRVLDRERAAIDDLDVRLLRGPLAGGPAAKRNHGAEAARGELLAFTDADCVPDSAWLERGLAAAEEADLVQGQTLAPKGAEPRHFAHSVTVSRDVGLHETCNIFYRRSLFEKLGGFSVGFYRRYGVPFGEDAELGWRARRSGARYRFEPAAVVRHPVGSDGMRSHLREQWLARGFPALAREVPELRSTLFYRRLFLTRRSAAFAAAVAGTALAPTAPSAALLALPYLRRLAASGDAARWLASDAVLAASLWYGSVRARRLVL